MGVIWMDVDAVLAEVPVNILSLIDDTDFKAREEGVTFDQAGMDLVWNFITPAGAQTQVAVTPTTGGGDYDWTSQTNGIYAIGMINTGGASANNDTEGFGWFTGFATGVLPWRGPVIGFRDAALNNLMIENAFSATRGLAGTALPDAVAAAAGGLAISTSGAVEMDTLNTLLLDIPTVAEFNARTRVAADYFSWTTDTVANVTAVGSVSGAVGSVAGNVGGNVVGTVGSVVGNVGGNVVGTVGSVVGSVGSVVGDTPQSADHTAGIADIPTVAEFNARTLVAANYYVTGDDWDEALAAHVGAGSFGQDVQAHALSSEIAALQDISVADLLTAVLTESYAADTVAPTLEQMLYMLWSAVADFSIAGTALQTHEIDGATNAMRFLLDNAANPTSRTRDL